MTLSTSTASQTFPGNGVMQIFPCGFRIFQASDISVSLINAATGVSTPLVLNSDYTLTGEGNQTGFTLSTSVPVSTGTNLLVARNIAYNQPTDFTNQGSFFPTMHEDCADRLGMQIQQLAGGIQRTLQLPDGIYPVASGTLPYPSPLAPLVWNAAGNGLANGSTAMTGDMLLRGNLANTSAGNGSSLVGYNNGGTDTTVSAMLDARSTVSVKEPRFGAKGDFVADDTAAFLAAITYLQTNNGYRGGTIRAPAGRYKLSATLAFTCYVAGQVHNIRIVGDGPQATTLDFSSAPAGSNGLEFTWGYHFEIADLTVTGAPQDNISICKPSAFNGANSAAIYAVRNVRSQSAGRYGVYSANSFMGRYSDVWCGGNAGGGFYFAGFHTSLDVTRCWASTNTGTGWIINGAVYSHWASCGADSNTLQGWKISNVAGVTLTSCGAEANAQDAFYVYTSTASATGMPASSQDIHGLTFIDCYAIGNSTQTVGGFASFIAAVTANSRPIEFKIQGGSVSGNASGDVSLVLFGTSGAVTCHKELFYDGSFTTADALSGTVEVKNQTVSGRRTVATIASAQSITSGVLTTAALAASPATNDLGSTVSSSAVVIPRGVNKVRLYAGADIAGNATGVRQLFLQKNGANLLGLPAVTTSGIAAGDSLLSVASGAISVVAGDTFSMQVYQNSGGALNLVQNSQTFLTVEAVS